MLLLRLIQEQVRCRNYLFNMWFSIAKIIFCTFSWLYNFIARNCWIILTRACTMVPNIIFSVSTIFIGFLHSHRHLSLFNFWLRLHFLPSNSHLQLHEICFISFITVFESFIACCCSCHTLFIVQRYTFCGVRDLSFTRQATVN